MASSKRMPDKAILDGWLSGLLLPFIFAGHFYATDLGLGHTITSLLDAHDLEAFNSLHLQLAIQLATQGSISRWPS